MPADVTNEDLHSSFEEYGPVHSGKYLLVITNLLLTYCYFSYVKLVHVFNAVPPSKLTNGVVNFEALDSSLSAMDELDQSVRELIVFFISLLYFTITPFFFKQILFGRRLNLSFSAKVGEFLPHHFTDKKQKKTWNAKKATST